MTQRTHLIAAFATLALLVACSSTPATRLYVLAAVAQAPLPRVQAAGDRAAAPVALVIKDVRLPQYLDRAQIVTRSDGHRLQMFEHEQWGGNLREDMTRILAENLAQLLESDRVIAAPHTMRLTPDYRLEVDVRSFEREAGGRVRLSARWWLTRGSDAALIVSPEASFSGAPLGEQSSYEALVGSMSAVYGELAQAIARSIRASEAGGA
jgi:uncharacterized lipoprotein YmbA